MFMSLLFSILVGFIIGIPLALVVIVIKKDGQSEEHTEEGDEDVPFICPVVGQECPKDKSLYAKCENCSLQRG